MGPGFVGAGATAGFGDVFGGGAPLVGGAGAGLGLGDVGAADFTGAVFDAGDRSDEFFAAGVFDERAPGACFVPVLVGGLGLFALVSPESDVGFAEATFCGGGAGAFCVRRSCR